MILSKKQNLDLINEHLTCRLCSGYLIDAWTINECLHSFCRACIFSYFDDNDENTMCPVCSAVPHPGNPLLGISKDCWLQQLVYKLVPSLFKREMCRRRIYYDGHSEEKSKFLEQYNKTHPSQMSCREEELGELSERCLFQQQNKVNQQEKIYLTLQYNDKESNVDQKRFHYLECSIQMPIKILKEYFRKVLPLSKRTHYQIDILYEQKILLDNFTLNHVHSWKTSTQEKQKQLHLYYRVIILERDTEISTKTETIEQEETKPSEISLNEKSDPINSSDEREPFPSSSSTKIDSNGPGFLRSSNITANPNSFVHTTPFTPAEARTISLNHSITEQMPSNETMELIKPKQCTLIDCKTITMTAPINYSVNSLGDISKTKKRPKKSINNELSSNKKCKIEKKKKIKGEKKNSTNHSLLSTTVDLPVALEKSPSENDNPNDCPEQKQFSCSEVIQEANKLLASEEPLTPINNGSSSLSAIGNTSATGSFSLSNPTTSRLTKPIATVSPLHTSKANQNRMPEKSDDDQLIDLSKTTGNLHPTVDEVPLKSDVTVPVPIVSEPVQERKKRSRQSSASTTRTKVSRHSNKSNHDEINESNKSLKKTLSSMSTNPYLSSTTTLAGQQQQQQQHQSQQMFQNFFHSFQNQANYWPINPWSVPPPLALMTDPRNYYSQTWTPAPPPTPSASMHPPKDLSSVSLNDFIGESMPSGSVNGHYQLANGSLMNSSSNFSRTTSSSSIHLHHNAGLHRPTPLNGTLS